MLSSLEHTTNSDKIWSWEEEGAVPRATGLGNHWELVLGRTLLLGLSAALGISQKSKILSNIAFYGFIQDQLWSDIHQNFYKPLVKSKRNVVGEAGASLLRLGSSCCCCDSGDKQDSALNAPRDAGR